MNECMNAMNGFQKGNPAAHAPEPHMPDGRANAKQYVTITNMLIAIGIPAHLKGYLFLKEAVKLTVDDLEMASCITKKLYPQIAKRFNTSTCKVEHSIRNAIESAWNKGSIMNLNTFFGHILFKRYERPSNGELIALLAEKINLDKLPQSCNP